MQSGAGGKDNGSVRDGAVVCADLLRARGRGVATPAGQDPCQGTPLGACGPEVLRNAIYR